MFQFECRTLHLLSFIRFLSAHLSTMSRSLWVAAQPSGVSTAPPSSCHLAEGTLHTDHYWRLINCTGPRTDPCGTLPVTGLQLDTAPLITTLWALQFSQQFFFSVPNDRKQSLHSQILICRHNHQNLYLKFILWPLPVQLPHCQLQLPLLELCISQK